MREVEGGGAGGATGYVGVGAQPRVLEALPYSQSRTEGTEWRGKGRVKWLNSERGELNVLYNVQLHDGILLRIYNCYIVSALHLHYTMYLGSPFSRPNRRSFALSDTALKFLAGKE